MVIHLRPYQRLALYHLRRCLEAGAWRQYVDLPTGTGKSTLAAAFAAQRLGQTQGRVLALLNPLGRSPYRWTAYSRGYFARVNAHVTAILERDPAQCGLYRSRQYSRQPEGTPEHQWIERRYLPLR